MSSIVPGIGSGARRWRGPRTRPRAGRGERDRGGGADAATRAGDDRNLAVEVHRASYRRPTSGRRLLDREVVGVEVAELLDALRAPRRPRRSRRRGRRIVERVAHLVPRRPASTPSAAAAIAASTRRPSSCAGRSGSSRRTPCPRRWSFAITMVTRFGSRRSSTCPSASANSLRRRRSRRAVGRAPTGAGPCSPTSSRRSVSPSWSSSVAQLERDPRAVEHVGGRAGVEVEHHRRRVHRVVDRAWWVCSSSAARLASQTSVGALVDDASDRVRRRPRPVDGPSPGACGRAPLLEERLAVDAVGAPHQRRAAGRRGGGASPARSGRSSRRPRLS